MNNILKIIGLILVLSFGVFMFFYGGMDDSPGAQGLGLLFAVGASVMIVRVVRRL